MRAAVLLLPPLLLCCAKEAQETVVRPDLGITVTFPGPSVRHTHEEDTPFGRMTWFDQIHIPRGSMAESFHVEVGNLPRGTQGGNTPQAVLETYRAWLRTRHGNVDFQDLDPAAGPGFRYRATGYTDRGLGGVLVVRRGRLHHAQGTAASPGDPRLAAFLDSFKVQ